MSQALPKPLKAPFPWFGGKSLVADVVWDAFGDVGNYVEPFFGSGAVLLNRPEVRGSETVNDKDGYVANFWRAVAKDPERVAFHADNPVNENDLHARHSWLVEQKVRFVPKLEGDPDFFDAKIAGWWAWGVSCWIGSGFCSGTGPWVVRDIPGERGVNRQLVHLAGEQGVNRKLVNLKSQDVVTGVRGELLAWMQALSNRLRFVRVCCGDWKRICGPTPTHLQGMTAVFLDPPYADTAERAEVYSVDDMQVAHEVREWAIEQGKNPLMRIALCGYEGEHAMPSDWRVHAWKANGGYEGQGKERSGNSRRERVWFSPACLDPESQPSLFTRPDSGTEANFQ
jgi:DNA adenine methylase